MSMKMNYTQFHLCQSQMTCLDSNTENNDKLVISLKIIFKKWRSVKSQD